MDLNTCAMKQLYLTPFEMEAIKDMCKNMIFVADNNPDYNHIGVAGVFVDGDMRNYPYAMIYVVCSDMSNRQLENLVNLCNSKHHSYKSALDGRRHICLERAFSNKEMMKFVTITNGGCCDIHTRREIKSFL